MPLGTYEEVIRAVIDRFAPGSLALPKAIRSGPVATLGRAPAPVVLEKAGRRIAMADVTRADDNHVVG